jgi:hypothetical protein
LQAGYGVFTGGAVVAGCMVADRYKQLHGTYHGKALVDVGRRQSKRRRCRLEPPSTHY